MPKFKLGERVERTKVSESWREFPAYGTVTAITEKGYTIQYDRDINGTEEGVPERDLRTIEQNAAQLDS